MGLEFQRKIIFFSYNITSITTKIRKALNRERTNVGRSAYTDRVKSILLECKKKEVAELLVNDLERFEMGDSHDELSWTDVSVHASKLLNTKGDVIFLTPSQLDEARDMIDHAKGDGLRVVTIPESVREKISNSEVRDLDKYRTEWNESFEFKFVKEKDLTKKERSIFNKTKKILALIGGKPSNVKQILISETMRPDAIDYEESDGIWEEDKQRIIIKRDQLRDLQSYAGTLLHEIAHATSGEGDVSREFESELTKDLGIISTKNLK